MLVSSLEHFCIPVSCSVVELSSYHEMVPHLSLASQPVSSNNDKPRAAFAVRGIERKQRFEVRYSLRRRRNSEAPKDMPVCTIRPFLPPRANAYKRCSYHT